MQGCIVAPLRTDRRFFISKNIEWIRFPLVWQYDKRPNEKMFSREEKMSAICVTDTFFLTLIMIS